MFNFGERARRVFLPIGLALLCGAVPASSQVPDPPPPPGQDELGIQLVSAFRTKNIKAYADLLADDLKVFQDGKLVSENKSDWLKKFEPKFVASGVIFTLSPGFSSSNRLLFIEYFNSAASWQMSPPPACCWRSDAVAYDIVGGKITSISRLRGGSRRLDETGKPSGN